MTNANLTKRFLGRGERRKIAGLIATPCNLEVDAMTTPYTLEQYVRDLRTITAQETDPVYTKSLTMIWQYS